MSVPKYIKFRGATYRKAIGSSGMDAVAAALEQAKRHISELIASKVEEQDEDYLRYLFIEEALNVADAAISSIGSAYTPLKSLENLHRTIMSKFPA